MSKTLGKQTHVLLDIWVAYVAELIRENPGSWTRYGHYTPMYYVFKKVNGKKTEIMNYQRFRKTLEHYFDRAKNAVIHGEAVDIGGGVGKVCMRRVERDFRKKSQSRINWHLTRKQPLVYNEQKKKLCYEHVIYYSGDDWVRVGWHRNKCIENETLYEFKPTAANSARTSGFTIELNQAMLKDPLLKYQFLYIPKTP